MNRPQSQRARWWRGLLLGAGLAAVAVLGSTAARAEASGGPAFATHYVRPGDSVWKVSQWYGAPVRDIAELNRLPHPSVVWAGTYLAVPVIDHYDIYAVKPGDTLFLIARRYGIPVHVLKEANALRGDMIVPGQRLLVPLGDAAKVGKHGKKPVANGNAKIAAKPARPEPNPAPRQEQARRAPVGVNDYELRLLAQMIEAEAGGEPYLGKVAVGAVIMNRVKSPLFPDTIEGVLFEPWQFEPVLNGTFWREPSAESWRAAIDAVNGVDPTGGALYFWNPMKSGYQPFLESRPSAGWIGNHRFAY
ncbi:MAG: cell wall hydrolase [Bacillota bacterium]|nr:MAG: cell wall hydrolase [Bacillota bacterium]